MLWHNFYSPSGGHRSAGDESRSPWGHLTGESAVPCFLNRKHPEEIQAEFGRRLTVLRVVGADGNRSLEGDIGFELEGADQLNDGWRQRIPGVADRMLTTRAFLIQAVKR